MKKNNIKTKIIGTALAALCAVSSLAAVSAVGASAASMTETSVSAQESGKACAFTMNGNNWTYWLKDNTNVSIKGNLNFENGTCRFIIKGLQPGVVNAVLKTHRPDGKWNNVPVRFTVDSKLNVTGKQTGALFVTNTKYDG